MHACVRVYRGCERENAGQTAKYKQEDTQHTTIII